MFRSNATLIPSFQNILVMAPILRVDNRGQRRPVRRVGDFSRELARYVGPSVNDNFIIVEHPAGFDVREVPENSVIRLQKGDPELHVRGIQRKKKEVRPIKDRNEENHYEEQEE